MRRNLTAMLALAPAAVDGLPVLLIGEGPQALENGAMAGLSLSGDRYVLDINLRSRRLASLEASSKLLQLARRIIE